MEYISYTIMTVDDEPDAREIVRQKFRRRVRSGELHILYAEDGQEALQLIQENPHISLVLTDINMPKMNGLSLLREIKNRWPSIYVVVVSAYGDIQNIRQAMNTGAFDFIVKPLDTQDLVKTVEKTLEEARRRNKLEKDERALANFQKEMNCAKELQSSILPQQAYCGHGYKLFNKMTTARGVGGDFYDFYAFEQDDSIFMLIADVCGKGMSAAIFMALARTITKTVVYASNRTDPQKAQQPARPHEIFRQVNRLISQDNRESYYITALLAKFDSATATFECCNAGHLPPLIASPDGKICHLLTVDNNLALGVLEDYPFTSNSFPLAPANILYFYTDGVTEAHNPSQELFGIERLKQTLSNLPKDADPEWIIHKVNKTLVEFRKDAPVYDDITQIALQSTIHRDGKMKQIADQQKDVHLEKPTEYSVATAYPSPDHKPKAIFRHATYCTKETLTCLLDCIEICCRGAKVADSQCNILRIVTEEVVLNAISYGLCEGQHAVFVEIEGNICQKSTTLVIQDNAKPFDPTINIIPPRNEVKLARMKAGGRGLHLCQQLLDGMQYSLENGKNCLRCLLLRS